MTGSEGQKMWGGRFERAPDASFYEFERSWQFDRRLLPHELALDRAWARAIAVAGILTHEEGQRIVAALDEIESRAESDAAWLDASQAEDVHHFAETALIEKLGPLGAKLHTGRSRNEMVATEFRMYVREAVREMRAALARLIRAVAEQAKSNLGVPMPGTTHMQHAQPLLLSHWLLAHGEAFQRDA
ncbi:MAG TPA: lyase family protein, partial [Candidatus Dormibacteraeota bacterium]|nr:lyase family protein [Candidatus Dormibacteraeota bacterium]